jgi:hypothetical protein
MWGWIRALLNSRRMPGAKLSIPKPSTRKPAARIAGEALAAHRVDPVGGDELEVLGEISRALGGDDRLAQRQDPAVAREHEDVVLEDDRAHVGMRSDDPLHHHEAFLGGERPTLAVSPPCASCRKLVEEQKVQFIGQ